MNKTSKIDINEIIVCKDGYIVKITYTEQSDSLEIPRKICFGLNIASKEKWSPDKFVRIIAEHMHNSKNFSNRRCEAKTLLENIKEIKDEKKFEDWVYKNFYRLLVTEKESNSVGERGIFNLYPAKSLSGNDKRLINKRSFRKEFAKSFFRNCHKNNEAIGGKKVENALYWFGDYKATEIELKENECIAEYGIILPEENNIEIDTLYKETIQNENYFENLIDLIPALPRQKIIGRNKDLENIKQYLDDINSNPTEQKLFVIHGLPGVGKTTLSILLANDKNIHSIFFNGVIWFHLGTDPSYTIQYQRLGTSFDSNELLNASSFEIAEQILSKILKKGRYLIIVDDIWQLSDLNPFIRLSRNTPVIITTRIREIINSLNLKDNEKYKLDILSKDDSLKLLEDLIPGIFEKHNRECSNLVNELEGLPLAIRVAGMLLRKQADAGLSVRKLIDEIKEGRHLLKERPPYDIEQLASESSLTVAALLRRSTDYLSKEARNCFKMLAWFPSKPAIFDFEDLKGCWEVNNTDEIIKELVGLGLLEPLPKTGNFQLHYLMMLLAKSLIDIEKNNDS
jgi:hypothetical protein